ncbi:hypothetical protein LUZ60_004030 [Juncus effusus]|nr:hypothetical protein LUZ60_004030 [Juncus effusus]
MSFFALLCSLFGLLTSLFPLLRELLTLKFLLEKLRDKLLDLVIHCITGICSNRPTAGFVRAELAPLLGRRTRIWTRLESVDQRWKIEDDFVLLWLSELRAVAFDIDDLEDEFETRLKMGSGSRFAELKSIWYYWRVLDQIGEINKRYDVINKDRKDQKVDGSDGARVVPSRKDPIPPQINSVHGSSSSNLRGRTEEKDKLLRLLRSPTNGTQKIKVISINGEGGVGKTALAQWVYTLEKNTAIDSFSSKIWVTLSPDLDLLKTTKKIIESITKKECLLSSLEMLQQKLQELVSGQKFLLILDSVWTENPFFWENIKVPLSVCIPGSTVLVTTRNKISSVYMSASDSNTIHLTSLDPNSCFHVLMDQALNAGPVSPELERIGMDIASRCNGSPLAAKLLGKILSSDLYEEKWQSLLDFMPSPDEILDNILPLLRLSYDSLPPHLKTCFKYCAIFPKGYEFNKDDLVKMWISENLIKSSSNICERKKLESAGKKQFNDLLSRSFFQLCDENNGKRKHIMPGAIHDLAQSVSEFECLRLDFRGVLHGKNCDRIRFGSLNADCLTNDSLNNLYDKKFLRTLIVYRNENVAMKCFDLKNLVKELKCLRSLNLSNCGIDKLPDCIGDLIHLRYLNLRGSSFKILPDSICKLFNLETLELGECNKLNKLPEKLSGLIKLCHIDLSLDWEKLDLDWKEFESMPPDLGKLTDLQTFSRFAVSIKDGCGISELKDLNNIHGEICISKLENVKNGDEAKQARLGRKIQIEFLFLKWSDNRKSELIDSNKEEQVMNNLSPSDKIKKIKIEGFNGSKFPNWMDSVHEPFSYLENINLSKCRVCVNLPKLGNLPKLKELYLQNLDKVTDLNDLLCKTNNNGSNEFMSLEILNISEMPELKTWFSLPNGGLNKLSKLIISNCPNLDNISYLPQTLKYLELRNCPILRLTNNSDSISELIVEKIDWKIIGWIQTLTSLESLFMLNILKLKNITEANLTRLTSIKEVKIEGCEDLVYVAKDVETENLSSLNKLEISSCENLVSFFDKGLPGGIKDIKLKCLSSLDSLPKKLSDLESLHMMEIHEAPMLKSIEKLHENVEYLYINGCPELEKRCKREGTDWDNIKHVKCKRIGEASRNVTI